MTAGLGRTDVYVGGVELRLHPRVVVEVGPLAVVVDVGREDPADVEDVAATGELVLGHVTDAVVVDLDVSVISVGDASGRTGARREGHAEAGGSDAGHSATEEHASV